MLSVPVCMYEMCLNCDLYQLIVLCVRVRVCVYAYGRNAYMEKKFPEENPKLVVSISIFGWTEWKDHLLKTSWGFSV